MRLSFKNWPSRIHPCPSLVPISWFSFDPELWGTAQPGGSTLTLETQRSELRSCSASYSSVTWWELSQLSEPPFWSEDNNMTGKVTVAEKCPYGVPRKKKYYYNYMHKDTEHVKEKMIYTIKAWSLVLFLNCHRKPSTKSNFLFSCRVPHNVKAHHIMTELKSPCCGVSPGVWSKALLVELHLQGLSLESSECIQKMQSAS